MLSLVVYLEKYEIEAERNQLIETNNSNSKLLESKEDEILDELKNSDPDKILDDDDLINKLSNIKEEANRINKNQEITLAREFEIKKERDNYVEIAMRTTILFFSITDMSKIEHM
mmetsp:Transcript_67941/g.146525  ORF Transcript_67941/g.146525 Transcript_67941/m.146525 type:complete len:115 (+) Transcript_67941:127-471(+)